MVESSQSARFSEDDLIPISALQHLMFCERQWALIHLEGVWTENRFTAAGKVLHEKVHGGECESRKDLRLARGLALRSFTWGLVGKADLVEFYRLPDTKTVEGARLPGRKGWWLPFPVEYKVGKPKLERCDEIQLCAQALCLEEMLCVYVPRGALYYGRPHQRREIAIDENLRRETLSLLDRLRILAAGEDRPKGRFDTKCESCSLNDVCLPRLKRVPHSVSRYVASMFEPPREDQR